MRKSILIALGSCLIALSLHAQTQPGLVRTVTRPDAPSQRLQGVVVRVQGDYNPVLSDEQGAFQVSMPGYKNGTAYTLAGINKGGYELREPELVGRQLPFSTSVPMEIVMVSRRQLQRDKQRIEQAARDNIERYFIEQMAERYARTDYNGMSAADSLIQQAIEQGDLNLAQERILAKGDPAEREKKMKRIRRLADAQRNELAEDYYHLHSIHMSRLQKDSALYYLLRRAELDTTNAQWQLDAGNFYDKMARSYDQALVLYRRALRYALANEGPEALRTAQAHNNIAYALARLGRYNEALPEQQVATELYVHIYGAAHPLSAARLMNLGALHYYLQRIDSAQHYFDRAEQVYTAIEASPEHEQNVYKLHAQLLNNQAALDVAKKNYEAAYERLNKAIAILPQEEEDDLLLLYRSMTAVCHFAGRTDDEQHFAQLAQTLAAKLGRN